MMMRALRSGFRTQMTQVDTAGGPRDSYVRLATAITWCDDALTRIETALADGVSGYRVLWEHWQSAFAPPDLPVRSLEPYTAASRALWWAGSGYLCLEMLFSALLFAYYFRLPTAVAIALGAAIAVFFALAMKGLPASLAAGDGNAPIQVRQKLTGLMWTLGPTHAVLMTLLALSRGGGAVGDVLNVWFDPLTAVLSVYTPILAGLMLAAATYYGWSARAEGERLRLEGLRGEIKVFKTECEERLAQLAITTPSRPAHGGSAGPHKSAGAGVTAAAAMGIAIAVGLASLVFATPAPAQTRSTIAIDIDASQSVNRSVAAAVVLGSFDSFVKLADQAGSEEIQITTFADDAFTVAPRTRIAWPPRVPVECAPFQPSDTARLIRRRYEAEHANWTQACAQRRAAARVVRERARAKSETDLRAALASGVAVTQPGCTALWDRLVLASQRRRSTLEVIFTDAQETCTRLKPVPRPAADVRVVVVVLPPARPSPRPKLTEAERFSSVKARLAVAAPWVEVVSPVDWPLDLGAGARPPAPAVVAMTAAEKGRP
jgi:hypothetical protein